MKISDEQLKEYISFVKKKYNRDLESRQAYDEFYMLLMVTARCYLPPQIIKLIEINNQNEYNHHAIRNPGNDLSKSFQEEYNKG